MIDPLTWDWALIAKTAFGAGVGSAAVQGALSIYKEYRVKENHAAYLALRVAVILEAYASACFDFVADNAIAQQRPDEQYPDWNSSLPTLHEYPIDVEGWRAMDRSLVARILNLPNKIHGSQNVIGANYEFAMDDNIIWQLDKHACERGLEGLEIASRLRSLYNLGPFDPVFDFAGALRRDLKRAEDCLEAAQAENARMVAAMPSISATPPQGL